MKKMILGIAIVALLAGCNLFDPVPPPVTQWEVEYEVSGTAVLVIITYVNSKGGTSQDKVPLPWSYSFTGKEGEWVYISASTLDSGGSAIVTIYKDKSMFKSGWCAGPWLTASAYGTL